MQDCNRPFYRHFEYFATFFRHDFPKRNDNEYIIVLFQKKCWFCIFKVLPHIFRTGFSQTGGLMVLHIIVPFQKMLLLKFRSYFLKGGFPNKQDSNRPYNRPDLYFSIFATYFLSMIFPNRTIIGPILSTVSCRIIHPKWKMPRGLLIVVSKFML